MIKQTALFEAHHQIRSAIPLLSTSEIQSRLIAFSLREISRAQKRINSIPSLSPVESCDLYYRLLDAYVIECGVKTPAVRRSA